MPDLFPFLAAGLVATGIGYLGLSVAMGSPSEPEPLAVELSAVPDAGEDIVLEWTGEQFEVDPSAPRFSVTV